MLTCNEVRPAGSWDEARAADAVVLDFDGRHRRRLMMTGQAGLAFLLDLPRATVLCDGDGLVLQDGRAVRVTAASEPLIEIAAEDLRALVRIAWHLGNRHLPTQLLGDRLRIRHDHVISNMVEGLGGTTRTVEAPFYPEGGAFASNHHKHDGQHEHPHRHG
jgi:urease accessory protein